MKSQKSSPGFEAFTEDSKELNTSEEGKKEYEEHLYSEFIKKVPPPLPLIAKQPYTDVEPLQAGIDAHFLFFL